MTVYGRVDLVSNCVSTAHGGCGQKHDYVKGAGEWTELTCPNGCEAHLLKDGLHAASPRDVPLTFDQQKAEEALAKQGTRNRDYLTAAVLAKLTGTPESAATLGLPSPGTPALPPVTCPDGHASPAGTKFCTSCGVSVTSPGSVRCPAGHDSPAGSRWCGECGAQIEAATPKRASEATATVKTTPAKAPAKARARQPART